MAQRNKRSVRARWIRHHDIYRQRAGLHVQLNDGLGDKRRTAALGLAIVCSGLMPAISMLNQPFSDRGA